MKKITFRSRVSVLLLLFITAACVVPIVLLICSGDVSNQAIYPVVGTLIFCYVIFFGISYTIKEDRLLVKVFGIRCSRIEVSEITFVKRSYNPLSAPAASLKRLCVDGYGVFTLISPVREQEFLDKLKEINPNINISVSSKEEWWRVWDWDI